MTRRNEAREFLEQAVRSNTDECILWPYATNPSGYPLINIPGESSLAHRVVLKRVKGPAPGGKPYACHEPLICNNPGCINHKHLDWKSQQSNCDDQVKAKTKTQIGASHSQAKLTEADVVAIRNDKRWPRFVAKDYSVSSQTIIDIRNRRSWKHVA